MSSENKKEAKKEDDEQRQQPTALVPRRFENIFDDFRRDMERMMTRPWPFTMNWADMPSPFEASQ